MTLPLLSEKSCRRDCPDFPAYQWLSVVKGQLKKSSPHTIPLLSRLSSHASYNHLGNNDGYNLNAEAQFKSKEIGKNSVDDDMVNANWLLYMLPVLAVECKATKGEHLDHTVLIKHAPTVGTRRG